MKSSVRLFIAAALSAFSLASMAAPAASKIAVIDESDLTDFPEYAEQHLAAPLKAAIQQRGLALYIETNFYTIKQSGYCIALAGLTVPAKGDLHARVPASTVASVVREPLGKQEWKSGDCVASAARNVVDILNESTLDDLLRDIDWTRPEGGTRAKKKADADMVSLYSDDLSADTKAAVFKAIHEYAVASVFDYRYATVTVHAKNLVMPDGQRVCWARASFVANPPNGREPHLPYNWRSAFHAGDDEATCARDAAVSAVQGKLDQSWDDKGLLKGFKNTREEGVPVPDLAAVAKKVAAIQAREQRSVLQQARTQQRNVVSCTNNCVNGACVRTFPNGRKENWQAPRVYDPLKNDWTWDTNSCGQ